MSLFFSPENLEAIFLMVVGFLPKLFAATLILYVFQHSQGTGSGTISAMGPTPFEIPMERDYTMSVKLAR